MNGLVCIHQAQAREHEAEEYLHQPSPHLGNQSVLAGATLAVLADIIDGRAPLRNKIGLGACDPKLACISTLDCDSAAEFC